MTEAESGAEYGKPYPSDGSIFDKYLWLWWNVPVLLFAVAAALVIWCVRQVQEFFGRLK